MTEDALSESPLACCDSLYSTHKAYGISRGNVSYRDIQDWKARSRVFAEIAAVTGRSLTLSDSDEPERFNGSTITANLFPMLGIQPILGRQMRPRTTRRAARAC